MNQHRKIHVAKAEVCKRQLETAIGLYFVGGDPLSIHSLAAAALGSISTTAKTKGVLTISELGVEYVIKNEYKREFRKALREAQNFFKHGDKDPDKSLLFDPAVTDFFLIDGCITYETLMGYSTPLMKVFMVWYGIHNPSCFTLPPELAAAYSAIMPHVAKLTREQFWVHALKHTPDGIQVDFPAWLRRIS